jgi:hypothetical protein
MRRPLRAEVSQEIARPVGEVFTALCEAETWPAWTRSAGSVQVVPAGPIRGGSVVSIVGRGVGARRARSWHVTDLRPDRLISLEDDGSQRRFWLQLEPSLDATCVTARVETPSGGAVPFLRRRAEESALRADLRRLKSVLESPGGAASLTPSRPTLLDTDTAPITSLESARRGR